MSAGRQALTDKEKAERANESAVEKLQRVGGPRVNKLLNAMDRVGDVGVLIKAASKDGVDGQKVVSQIQNAIAAKFKEMSGKLASGERTDTGFRIDV